MGACRVIVRLDAPEDGSEAVARELLGPDDLLLCAPVRRGPAHARYDCYVRCSDEEICVLLDADDYLYDAHVLCNLALRYLETNALVTYGGMRYLKDGKLGAWWNAAPFPKEVVERRSYRQESWRASHLKTAYAAVLKAVPPEYLQLHGEWLLVCTDVALMHAALELAGQRHALNDFSACVYDADASSAEITSYYRRHEDPNLSAYRSEVMAHLSNLPALESRTWPY
jgi:glycosyltransferase involved in cell wall biosynthesis